MCYHVDDCVKQDTHLQSQQTEGDPHAMAASEVGFSYTRAPKENDIEIVEICGPWRPSAIFPQQPGCGSKLLALSLLVSPSRRAVTNPYRNQLQNVQLGGAPPRTRRDHGGLGKGL